MKVSVRRFGGMRPIISPDLLEPGEAQTAQNAKLTGGALEALRDPLNVLTLSGSSTVRAIYRFGQTNTNEAQWWFQSLVDADFVRGMVDGDTQERTYYTTATGTPRKTDATIATSAAPYPSASYEMGVKAPVGAISASVTGTPTDADDAAEGLIYCMTYVTGWGEESAPGPNSSLVSRKPGQSTSLTGIPTAPTGNYNVTAKRIYRSATGSSATRFQFLAELSLATTSYTDTTLTTNLGEVLLTKGWAEPPTTMRGLTAMANGILAGFSGNTLCLSVPYTPYAWPTAYQLSVDGEIVGIAAFDQSLFVGTTTGIYVVTGSDPSAMAMEKLAIKQSCVSKRSVVPMLGGVVWASPDGLMYVGSSGVRNLTETLLDRRQWQAYVPSSISAYECEGRYLAFYNTGSTTGGLVFDLGATPSFTTTDLYATAGYRDPARDALYLVTGNTQLVKWDAATTAADLIWKSGVIRTSSEVPWAVARVDAETYPVTFSFIAGSTYTVTVNSARAFRLPPGRTDRFALQVASSSTGRIREVAVADSMGALAADG